LVFSASRDLFLPGLNGRKEIIKILGLKKESLRAATYHCLNPPPVRQTRICGRGHFRCSPSSSPKCASSAFATCRHTMAGIRSPSLQPLNRAVSTPQPRNCCRNQPQSSRLYRSPIGFPYLSGGAFCVGRIGIKAIPIMAQNPPRADNLIKFFFVNLFGANLGRMIDSAKSKVFGRDCCLEYPILI